jgi:hypothetical protein
MKRTLVTVAIFGLLAATAPLASARKWTSNDGKYSVEAELVELADGRVRLKKAEGATVTVSLERLSEADRQFLATLRKKDASYVGDVEPFLTKYCLECHNQGKAKAGYNVETFADVMRGGKKGPMVVPGKPAESRLILTLQGKGKPMPPKKSRQPTAEETAKVFEWIKAGARDDSASEDLENTR